MAVSHYLPQDEDTRRGHHTQLSNDQRNCLPHPGHLEVRVRSDGTYTNLIGSPSVWKKFKTGLS